MFYELIIQEVDLTNFIAPSITTMKEMFYGCSRLISVKLSNIEVSSVQDISYLFYGYRKLQFLDLSNFKASPTQMQFMFFNCYEITSLDLSGITTSNVNDMGSLFSGCRNLIFYGKYKINFLFT